MEDGGQLVLDDGHLPLVFHKLGEDLLGGALRLFLLNALDRPAREGQGLMFATRSFAHSAWYHSSSVFIWLNSAMDSR